MSERLDQIERILLANTSQIATLLEGQIKLQAAQTRTQVQLDQAQVQLDGLTRDFRASITDVVTMVGNLVGEMHVMQSEIRGLQTENRHILEVLQGRQGHE